MILKRTSYYLLTFLVLALLIVSFVSAVVEDNAKPSTTPDSFSSKLNNAAGKSFKWVSGFFGVQIPEIWREASSFSEENGVPAGCLFFIKKVLIIFPFLGPTINNNGFDVRDIFLMLIAVFSIKIFFWIAGFWRSFENGIKFVLDPTTYTLFRYHSGVAYLLLTLTYLFSTFIPTESGNIIVDLIGILIRTFYGFWVLFPLFMSWSIYSKVVALMILWCVFFKINSILYKYNNGKVILVNGPARFFWIIWPILSVSIFKTFHEWVFEQDRKRIQDLVKSQAADKVALAVKGVEYWAEIGKRTGLKRDIDI